MVQPLSDLKLALMENASEEGDLLIYRERFPFKTKLQIDAPNH